MSTLLDIPLEVVEHILAKAEPFDVASFAQTCRIFRSLIYHSSDQHLWRSLFLAQPFDDPRKCLTATGRHLTEKEYDWRGEVQRRSRAQKFVSSDGPMKPGEIGGILKTLVSMIVNIPPTTLSYDYSGISRNLVWLAQLLRQGSFIDRCTPEITEEEAQTLAKLHTLFGLTPADLKSSQRAASRAYVYDMRNYTQKTAWGPFLPDGSGRVNWLHLRAIQHVMSLHAIAFDDSDEAVPESHILSPMSLPFCQTQLPGDG